MIIILEKRILSIFHCTIIFGRIGYKSLIWRDSI